jgi:hypothetical protein
LSAFGLPGLPVVSAFGGDAVGSFLCPGAGAQGHGGRFVATAVGTFAGFLALGVVTM